MNAKKTSAVISGNMAAYEGKTKTPIGKLILLGMLAGAFIAMGASSSSAATFGITNVGLAKCLAGTIFPVGLILIVLVGGELFTGDCLMIFGVMDKRINIWQMLKVLIIVWLSNVCGSVLIAFVVSQSGQYDLGSAALGAAVIKTAYAKTNLTFVKAFCSGIMCNILVCLAVLAAGTAQSVIGKIFSIFFPIWAFVTAGFEHCVANMYYIPAGIIAKSNQTYYDAAINAGLSAEQLSSLTIKSFLLNNMLPVTLGNIVGGMIFVALPLYLINKKDIKESK